MKSRPNNVLPWMATVLTGESVYSASGTMVRLAAQVYDASGNRTARAVTENGVTEFRSSMLMPGDRLAEWTSENASGAYAVVTNAAYFYAASGCTTGVVSRLSDGTNRTVKYSWTDDYRLDGVCENGETVAEYKYDALGNLVSVGHGAESFEILVDEGHTLADVSEDGTPLRVYMRGPGVDRWLGFVDLTGGSPIPYFYVTDHLGSVLAVTDASGAVVERYEYDAWGKVLSVTDSAGQSLTRSAIGNRILWQGREYSWATWLYYFRSRWYDPDTGRWLSKDPIGLAGGLNLYAFCDGDPVNGRDPMGQIGQNAIERIVEAGMRNPIDTDAAIIWAIRKEIHWSRNAGRNERVNLPQTPQEAMAAQWNKLPHSRSIYHRLNNQDNTKYVSPDGHLEAVYDNTGNLVDDSLNRGTYNYYDPSTQPFLHGLFDVVPYLLWGNDPDDFENPWPRINAGVDAIGDWMGNLFHAEEVEK